MKKLIFLYLILFLVYSCSKDNPVSNNQNNNNCNCIFHADSIGILKGDTSVTVNLNLTDSLKIDFFLATNYTAWNNFDSIPTVIIEAENNDTSRIYIDSVFRDSSSYNHSYSFQFGCLDSSFAKFTIWHSSYLLPSYFVSLRNIRIYRKP